jgi:hypothetical protein
MERRNAERNTVYNVPENLLIANCDATEWRGTGCQNLRLAIQSGGEDGLLKHTSKPLFFVEDGISVRLPRCSTTMPRERNVSRSCWLEYLFRYPRGRESEEL